MPVDDPDPERARMLCAAVTRDLLEELAPALVLLPATDRQRVQALVAYTRTLFDFALEGGMHGERLARINRWEFGLEQTLEGEAPGQPVFVAMAEAQRVQPWDREALDAIAAAARRVATRTDLDASIPALVTGICQALTGRRPSAQLSRYGSDLLLSISNHRRRAAKGAPLTLAAKTRPDPSPLLSDGEMALLAPGWRRVLIFLTAAAARIESRHPRDAKALGLLARIGLLIRARLSR